MKRLALLLAFLPPATTALPACNCPDEGSYAEFTAESMAKEPVLEVTGARTECMHRDRRDQCDGVWLIPSEAGTVTVTLRFPDGTTASDSVEYLHDGAYPCRGDLRPVHDKVIRL